ncbi:MAG: GPW/gp25 family protein [Gaiellales bacterium]
MEHIGSGLGFPLRLDRRGVIELVRDDEDVQEAIALILGTARGERPMRPEFGCGIHDHLFGGIDGYTVGQIEHEIRVALERWEPRIDVTGIQFEVDEDSDSGMRLLIDIGYVLRATNDARNLVFPFYMIPEEELA